MGLYVSLRFLPKTNASLCVLLFFLTVSNRRVWNPQMLYETDCKIEVAFKVTLIVHKKYTFGLKTILISELSTPSCNLYAMYLCHLISYNYFIIWQFFFSLCAITSTPFCLYQNWSINLAEADIFKFDKIWKTHFN